MDNALEVLDPTRIEDEPEHAGIFKLEKEKELLLHPDFFIENLTRK